MDCELGDITLYIWINCNMLTCRSNKSQCYISFISPSLYKHFHTDLWKDTYVTFTFNLLSDTFIQSDLQM